MDRRRPRNPPIRQFVLLIERHEDTPGLYALTLSVSIFKVGSGADDADADRRAWELLHNLKRSPCTRDIPTVAVSGYGRRSLRDRADRESIAAFFLKPSLPDELVAGLRRVRDAHTHAHAEQ